MLSVSVISKLNQPFGILRLRKWLFCFLTYSLTVTDVFNVWLSEPKTKSAFYNLEGQIVVFRSIGQHTQLRILLNIGSLSVFKIGIVGTDCNPQVRFIKVISMVFCDFLILFSSLHTPFKICLLFFGLHEIGFFNRFFKVQDR